MKKAYMLLAGLVAAVSLSAAASMPGDDDRDPAGAGGSSGADGVVTIVLDTDVLAGAAGGAGYCKRMAQRCNDGDELACALFDAHCPGSD